MDQNFQQLRFGGLKWGAACFGWLVTAAVASLLFGLIIASAGATGVNLRLDTTHLSQAGLWGTLIILAVWVIAFYSGGYVAGRMTRFDSGRQGIGVWIVNLITNFLLSLVALIFGPVLNLLPMVSLPHLPIGEGSITVSSALTLLLALFLTALAALGGGKAGQLYHSRIDEALLTAAGRPDLAASTLTVPTPRPSASGRYAPTFGERVNSSADGTAQKPRS